MLLNNQSMILEKDGLTNSVVDIVPNVVYKLVAPFAPWRSRYVILKVVFSFVEEVLSAIEEPASLDIFFFQALLYVE